jgi:flavin-dependent dehydrogenase
MSATNNYDAIILGGGLAGLTLAMQLKQENAEINVLVLERREDSAPEAAHKVGESTVELATHYLREVLNLKDYLDEHQLPKHGLRFFFSPQHKDEINKRVELGPKVLLPVPSHQIDRGIFENDLIQMNRELGVKIEMGSKVKDVEFGEEQHTVTYELNGEQKTLKARWVVDATGRGSFMKRKLGFAETVNHDVNAAWFRVDWKIDIDDWSDDPSWHAHVEPGLRYLSTVHLMDAGYWVWIIPLTGDKTSVGIVADPAIHPFESFNKLDKALAWIEKNEPQLAHELKKQEDGNVLDFKVMKHFAHGSKELFHTDRWAVTGESGLFADPFYSPGSDFISMANTWTADLIQRDLKGEDVFFRTKFYTELNREFYDNWMPLYINQYPMWGKAQTMTAKIYWDWGAYWGMNTLLFTNNGLTDLDLLRKVTAGPTSTLNRYGELSRQMQQLFNDFGKYDTDEFDSVYLDPFDLPLLKRLQEDIVEKQFEADELHRKFDENIKLLEHFAAETYRLMSHHAHGTNVDMEVDPYTMSLSGKSLTSPNSISLKRDDAMAKEIKSLWLYPYPETVTA